MSVSWPPFGRSSPRTTTATTLTVGEHSDGDRVTGLFFVSHEITGMNERQVRDGQVLITPGDDRHRYLDA